MNVEGAAGYENHANLFSAPLKMQETSFVASPSLRSNVPSVSGQRRWSSYRFLPLLYLSYLVLSFLPATSLFFIIYVGPFNFCGFLPLILALYVHCIVNLFSPDFAVPPIGKCRPIISPILRALPPF
jgi:hypothetical protein